MFTPRILAFALAAHFIIGVNASAQEAEDGPTADPAALKAFTEIVHAYRALPALTVKSTVKIELAEGETESTGSEVKGEFIFGPNRAAVIKLNNFTCYLNPPPPKPEGEIAGAAGDENGTITVVHDKNKESYFTSSDDGSPYYALLNLFKDMPFPELAIELGFESIDDVLLQFHPKALSGVVPTKVESKEENGQTIQRLILSGENETLKMVVDPQSKLIQSIDLRITGGGFVQPGAILTYKHSYEYQTHDKPLDPATFVFDPGVRQPVDMVASLTPRPARPDPNNGEDGGNVPMLAGEPAPGFVLSSADGKAVDLADLQGKVVVLDFWASWCGPCMAALPKLHEVAKWVTSEELPAVVYTINVWEVRQNDSPDARLESAKATWTKRGFTLPILMDYTDETAAAYGVNGIPTTVVIRSDGIVHKVHVGASPNYADDLKKDIQEALKAVE